jgi:hypothetical protein
MRRVLTGVCLSVLALSLGCNMFKPPADPAIAPAPKWGAAPPKAEDLVAYLNRNGQALTSIEAKKTFIKAKQGDETPIDLESYLACQKGARPGIPPYFRLQSYVFGNSEADIGSNSQEFWFWIKRSPQPYVYHCSYADYPQVAARGAMPFPFQPEWVVEALGMAEYDPKAAYETHEAKSTYDLVQRTRSPRGNEVIKVIAFHKAPRVGASWVAAYMLYEADAKGKPQILCSAVIEESRAVALGGGKSAVLPTRVRLNCPREKMELTIDLGTVQPNVQWDQGRINDLFTRKTLQNYKSYDLARGPDSPASEVRPAGGLSR